MKGRWGVTIDGIECLGAEFIDDTHVSCLTPAHVAADDLDVELTFRSQTVVAEEAFSYVAPAAYGVSPSQGWVTGSQAVTITGSAMTYATSVTFDGLPCTGLSIINDDSLTCVTPAHTLGAVDVTVNYNNGQSVTPHDGFKYLSYIDLSFNKDYAEIEASPSLAVEATDITIATVETTAPNGYSLSMVQGANGPDLVCAGEDPPILPITPTDNATSLGVNSWGVGLGTAVSLPSRWRKVSSTPVVISSSALWGVFDIYLYFGARVNYMQKPCSYTGMVMLTAMANP